MNTLLHNTSQGLYCSLGDFFVDPQRPVERAVVTHAHSDHARWGCAKYLATTEGEHLLRLRLSPDSEFTFLPYGQSINVGGVNISFHPSGHILGAAQVRLEYQGRVEVVTGDYKLQSDPTCSSWEPISCDLLVTESTFGLPVYRWPAQDQITQSLNAWWRSAREKGKCCVLFGYAIGKSQRLLAELDPDIGPIYTHGAVEKGCDAYRRSGVKLPETTYVGSLSGKQDWSGAMVIAVPSAQASSWMRRFGKVTTAMASGWMMIRGSRRRRNVDRGFVISDHVDWTSLLQAVELCNPETVWVTHGYSAAVARYLREMGRDAWAISNRTRQEGDEDDITADDELAET